MIPATLLRRFWALFIDWLIILAYASCLLGATLLVCHIWLHHVPNLIGLYGPSGAHLIGFAALTLPMSLYFICTESSAAHASVGKRVAKIRVVSTSKNPLSFVQEVVRTIIKFLPWEIAHTAIYQLVAADQQHRAPSTLTLVLLILANILPIAYIVTAVLRKDHRAPHDLIAKTLVVKA